MSHLDGKQRRQQMEEHKRLLKHYAMGEGLNAAKALASALPTLPVNVEEMLPLPGLVGPIFWLPFAATDVATKAVAFANVSQKTNLHKSLESEWLQAHEAIPDDSTIPLPPAAKENRCCLAGTCLCSGDGVKVWNMKNKLLRDMKLVFKAKHLKDKLVNAQVVACFRKASSCKEHLAGSAEFWMHCGHMSLSPYKPTMCMLVRADGHVMAGTGNSRRVVLQVTCKAERPSAQWKPVKRKRGTFKQRNTSAARLCCICSIHPNYMIEKATLVVQINCLRMFWVFVGISRGLFGVQDIGLGVAFSLCSLLLGFGLV
eukprot:6154355-Amphidinium_carterae.1